MTIDQRQLRYFIEVATVGSINKAAERLHIAQPALSRRMHQLEHELGVSLMVRRPSGVTLTPAGRKLLGRAAAIVDELQRLRDGIDDAPEDAFRHIQIGMVPGPSLVLLTRLLATFHREQPDILLKVVDGTTPSLCEMVLNRGLDVALVTDPPANPRLAQETLWREAIFVVGPPGFEDDRQALLDLPFIMPTPNTAIQSTIEAGLEQLGASVRVDLTVAATATVKQLVTEGRAYTVLPYSTLANSGGLDAFTTIEIDGVRVNRDLVWRAGEAWSDDTAALVDSVRSIVREVAATVPEGWLISTVRRR